ncbi:MAG: undecaprenyl diphosphate synthase [Fimbriimonadaceae bacterium]|jgi:undecaprenyl diphosphate synthase|nr:undecaprenyl diphosphate synthase [Fimbriimonadaceae bacterium]
MSERRNTVTPQHRNTETPTQARAREIGIDNSSIPPHVAVIMDGNGRWAKKKGLPRLLGHREGYKTLRGILLAASELGIKYLTVYAFSAENWRRPEDEVKGLMSLIEKAARDELRLMHQNNVRVNVSGRIHELPEGLQRALNDGMQTTKDNTGITFTLAVNYGGRAEIVDAVKRLAEQGTPAGEITEELISASLYNPGHPDPDLMIRTAGEMRWSNFLLWQGAYCELYVTEKSWPEFKTEDLLDAVKTFQQRTRKFGAVVD